MFSDELNTIDLSETFYDFLLDHPLEGVVEAIEEAFRRRGADDNRAQSFAEETQEFIRRGFEPAEKVTLSQGESLGEKESKKWFRGPSEFLKNQPENGISPLALMPFEDDLQAEDEIIKEVIEQLQAA